MHNIITPDPEESYWDEMDLSLSNNMVAILFRLYTLKIQYQDYDYIMFQISNYLIAGNPVLSINDIYFLLQDERLEGYKLIYLM